MRCGRIGLAALAAGWLVAAVPTAAQFSDSYTFLKAVRDRDGQKVTELIDKPGTNIVNTRDDSGESALMIAAKRRDMTWVSFLLSKGARADARDRDGNTALAHASLLGFAEGVRLLAPFGGVNTANNRGETPLILATQQRDLATVRLLLGAGANAKQQDRIAGKSALDYAAEDRRSTALLKVLQEAGAPAKQVAGPTQ